ncbi:MAG: methyl-accepting chemotaxis protein [Pseudomonadota bacterium]
MKPENQTPRSNKLAHYDKVVFFILMAHIPVVAFLVPLGFGTSAFATVSAVVIGLITSVAYYFKRGTPIFGFLAGIALMAFSAVMIQAQLGRLEMHFHIFGALAILLIYRNWLNIAVAAGVIAVHHLAFTALQLNGATLGGVPIQAFAYDCSWSITFVHAAFVVFESAVLIYFSIIMRREERSASELVTAVKKVQREQDLSVRIDSGANIGVEDEFNNLLANFDKLTHEISNVAQSIDITAENLNQSASLSHQSINQQTEQTEAVVDAMDDMTQTIQTVTSQISSMSEAANAANDQANVASREVDSSVKLAQQLESSMSMTSSSIKELAKSAESIGSVVGVIQSISEQTNLLALNAAIEAARAGESGRGFAVVADEVRTLAQRTRESTTEIQGIIEQLQSVTQNAVSNIESGQNITRESVEGINSTHEALKHVFTAVSSIDEMNARLNDLANKQLETVDFVTQNIKSIASLSQTSMNKAEENRENCGQLATKNKQLLSQIGQYKHS